MSQTNQIRSLRRTAAVAQTLSESSDEENIDPTRSSWGTAHLMQHQATIANESIESRVKAMALSADPNQPRPLNEPLDTLSHNIPSISNKLPRRSRTSVRASRKSVQPKEDGSSTTSAACIQMTDSTTAEDSVSNNDQKLTGKDDVPISESTDSKHSLLVGSIDVKGEQLVEEACLVPAEKPVLSSPVKQQPEKPMDIVIRSRSRAIPAPEDAANSRPRTIITYLVLDNFKSYAGRQEVGPFHASFSSVVGPNGSGKSNVIDSLLFVFGFRASKMRQGKVSALIHYSASHPDLGYCEVQVHFREVLDQPCGKSEPISGSDMVISRKAFKNNSSKYYIDGAESNFTAVTTLLRDRGIDLDHKRFLILQGEVESIAQMKPKAANEHDDGLLEYLEDIIGTSKYKSPIEESAAEIETLNEVCTEKSQRVQHVEKERKSLEAHKDAALALVKDENELAVKQSALYQIYVNDCEGNIQVSNDSVAQMQKQLDEEILRHRGNEENILNMQETFKAEEKQYEHMLHDTNLLLKRQEKVDREMVKLEEKRKHLNAKIKKFEKAIGSNHSASSEAKAEVDRSNESIERNAAAVDQIQRDLQIEEEHLAQIRENLQAKTEGLSDEISAKQRLLDPWLNQIEKTQSMIKVAQSELSILKHREDASVQAVQTSEARCSQLKDEMSGKLKEREDLTRKQKTLQSKKSGLENTVEVFFEKEALAKQKISSARQRADEARANLSHAQNQGSVLTGLTRLQESGRIKGFHGKLGDLGVIDQKYDIAISTACPQLEHLVVDNVEVGQHCIEHLRKNNLGRANFIILDRLASRDSGETNMPEAAPRLFDLVQAKEDRFRPAFFSVLQNTLVAADIEQANRIAYGAKRWRVVTLDGQLIDKSGAMSGGGNKVAKGLMSSKIREGMSQKRVSDLESEVAATEQEWASEQVQHQSTREELLRISDEIPSLTMEIQKCSLVIESLQRNIADAESRCSELHRRAQAVETSDNSNVKGLEQTIAQHEEEILKLKAESSGIELEISALQDKIMEIGGIRLRSQKAKVDGLRDQINTLSEEISNAEVNKARMEKQQKKHEKAKSDASSELEHVVIVLEQLDKETRTQEQDTSGFRREAEEAQESLDMKKEELSELKAEVERQITELNAARGKEMDMRNKLEDEQKVLNENQKRLKYWQEKLGKLSISNISELGIAGDEVLASYTPDELLDLDKDLLKGEIAILEEKIQGVNVDLSVLEEYRRRVDEHGARSNDLAAAVSNRDKAKKRCEELRSLRLEGFMEGFSAISLRLKEMYQMITMGGNAELELVDSLDPFSEGILFSVMPPKKSWKNISNLSGGEKTLSSLALVFALHHYKPTPLYVMDEIDAALDFRNVSIVASYIKERTKNAQFIVISLRNNMFELAARLVGVYKVNQMTKSVTVENRDYIVRSKR